MWFNAIQLIIVIGKRQELDFHFVLICWDLFYYVQNKSIETTICNIPKKNNYSILCNVTEWCGVARFEKKRPTTRIGRYKSGATRLNWSRYDLFQCHTTARHELLWHATLCYLLSVLNSIQKYYQYVSLRSWVKTIESLHEFQKRLISRVAGSSPAASLNLLNIFRNYILKVYF